jgi:hypothetical protein
MVSRASSSMIGVAMIVSRDFCAAPGSQHVI